MKSDPARDARDKHEGAGLPRPDPLDPLDPPPEDRYCDLVLTGGVTDGVIYPWAIVEIARKYRFNDIGGTSVGAMAAALTAAAEYGRRYGSLVGFNEVLLKLPDKLAEEGPTAGKTKLFSLFQPQESTRRLFDIFVSAFGGAPGSDAWVAAGTIAGAILKAYRRWAAWGAVAGFAFALVFAFVFGLIAAVAQRTAMGEPLLWARLGDVLRAEVGLTLVLALVLSVVFGLVLIGYGVYRDLTRGLVDNGYGLCSGCRDSAAGPQTLIEWLHQGIQAAAGLPLDRPLTFRDLWDAPGGPAGNPLPPAMRTRNSRSIDLRMVSTNLTHGRPYDLPARDQTSRLFFRREELARYFPAPVLDHLMQHARRYEPKSPGSDPDPAWVPTGLCELPDADLPIIVATRLSLSFPILFSAVPLWAIDYEAPSRYDRQLRKCWFSDGGICSNFPIHLFDSALPQWPTFGISLAPRSRYWSGESWWITKYHSQGRGDSWNRFDEDGSALCRLVGFVFSIVWSAKDWNDKTSMRMPGVRDRVVHVAMDRSKGEGGLDLMLTGKKILECASRYGLPAGKALVDKFLGSAPGNSPSTAWNEHRWVRFNSLLAALRERIEGFTTAADHSAYAEPLLAQIVQATQDPPLAESDGRKVCLSAAQKHALVQALDALKELEAKLVKAAVPQPYTPIPTPTVHLRPPL